MGQATQSSTQVMGQAAGASHHEDSIESVSFHPSGHPLVATASLDGSMIVWDVNTMTPRVVCKHPRGVIRVLWAQKGTNSSPDQLVHDLCLYTCCLDGRVRLWDARSGKCEREFQGFTKAVLDMDATPDGRYILAGSDDGTARVFTVQ